MKTEHSNSKGSSPVDRREASTPYDPLDLRTLAESMVRVVLEQKIHPLGDVPSFEGAGIYIIYYTGDFESYKSIAQKTRDVDGTSRFMSERPPGREEEREGSWRWGRQEEFSSG